MFKLPIPCLEDSICSINKQSTYVDMMWKVVLIIWDEVAIQHRHCLEAIDRNLDDIQNNLERVFGKITIVFRGDFYQILPVVSKGSREQSVDATL